VENDTLVIVKEIGLDAAVVLLLELGVAMLLLLEVDPAFAITAATIVAIAPISAIMIADIVFGSLRRGRNLDLGMSESYSHPT
jgi:hypothetical protein